MGFGLQQFQCLGVLACGIRMAPQKARRAPVVLLGKYDTSCHATANLPLQFGEAFDVLLDGFLDEAACVQIGLGFGQRGFEFALAQVRVLLAAHHHVFHLAAHGDRGFRLVGEGQFDGADALGF